MKKIWAFQKLLICSWKWNIRNDAVPFRSLFVLFLICGPLLLGSWLGISFLNLEFVIVSAIVSYLIIRRKDALFRRVPVSTRFMVFNFYILAVGLAVAVFLAAWIGLSVLLLLLILILTAFGLAKASAPSAADAIAQIPGEWKSVLFAILIYLVILFVVITLACLPKKKLRRITIPVFCAVLFAFLLAIKWFTPNASDAVINISFFPTFSLNPYANTVLIGLVIFTACALPLCVRLGLKWSQPASLK